YRTRTTLADFLPWRTPGAGAGSVHGGAEPAELLDLVGLGHLPLETPAGSLAYGERKRLEIARALAAAPRLVLLDEPVSGMGSDESDQVAEIIRKIRARGVSVLLVAHDVGLVLSTCDRIIVLNYGRKIAE